MNSLLSWIRCSQFLRTEDQAIQVETFHQDFDDYKATAVRKIEKLKSSVWTKRAHVFISFTKQLNWEQAFQSLHLSTFSSSIQRWIEMLVDVFNSVDNSVADVSDCGTTHNLSATT